jgi:hypothetical protein
MRPVADGDDINELPQFLREKTMRSVRRELQSIMDSYHHFWDILAELLQNSRDGIERRQREEREQKLTPTPGRIHLSVDAVTRTIEVSDNGIGIPPDFVAEVLAPGGGDKAEDEGQVGEKGVGLTYAAFSGNAFRLDTSHAGAQASASLTDAASWLSAGGNRFPTFSMSTTAQRPEVSGLEHGSFTSVSVGAVPTTEDVDLFQLSIADFKWILRTRTAVGDTRKILAGKDLPDLEVTYRWNGAEGVLEGAVEVGYPDLAAGQSSYTIEEVQKQFVSKDAPAARRKFLSGKVVTGRRIFKQGSEEIRVYGVMLPGNKGFEDISTSESLTSEMPHGATALLKAGIFVSTKFMPTGIEIEPAAMGAYPAYYKRCHFVVESDRIEFDLGRKSMHWRPKRRLQEAVGQLFVEFEKVATYQGDPPTRRVPSHETPAERKHRVSQEWKSIESRHDLNWPGVPFAKVPTRQEAAVAALFHELVASGKLDGYTPLATGYSSQYDLHVHYGEKSLPLVVEFKNQLESIVDDFREGVKVQGDIDMLVCWDVDEAKLATVGLTLESCDKPPYAGVTHELNLPSELSSETIPVIVLRTLRDRMVKP